MQVWNRLTSVPSGIDDRPKSGIRDALRTRYVAGGQHDVPEQGSLLIRYVIERGNVFLGDHEHMSGCLRPDVAKGENPVRLVHDIRSDHPVDNLAKQAILVCHLNL